jgi:hypothetical protein
MLNDVPVKKGLLKDGDVLSVGATRVEVVLLEQRQRANARRERALVHVAPTTCTVASAVAPGAEASESGMEIDVFGATTWRPGQDLAGAVMFPVALAERVEHLEVACVWRVEDETRALGPEVEGCKVALSVRSAAIRFQVEVPSGPLSYQGKLFSVRWRLVARARMRDGGLVKATQGFVLAPWDDDAEPHRGYRDTPRRWTGDYDPGPCPLPGGEVLHGSELALALGWLGSAMSLARSTARLVFYEAQISAPTKVRAGQPVDVRVRVRSHQTVTVTRVTLCLRGREVLRGAIPRIHVLYEDAQVATDGPVPVLWGGEEVFQARFAVPGNAPGSFGTDGQLLVWSLAAEVAVSMCPNWVVEQVVEVSRGDGYRRGSDGR